MVAHAPRDYYLQHDTPAQRGVRYPIAHAPRDYFLQMPDTHSYVHGGGRGSRHRHGRTKHGKAGAHGQRHESPLPPMRDPWGHRAQGRIRGR